MKYYLYPFNTIILDISTIKKGGPVITSPPHVYLHPLPFTSSGKEEKG
jgi:hypothetical protein